MNYHSEVRNWLKDNPRTLYNKYIFIQVFKEVWLKLAKVEYTVKGFEELGIYPVNPDAIKKGKLAPAEVYKQPEPLPEMRMRALSTKQIQKLQMKIQHRHLLCRLEMQLQ